VREKRKGSQQQLKGIEGEIYLQQRIGKIRGNHSISLLRGR